MVGATSGTSATPCASHAASTGADSSSGRSGTIRPLMPRSASSRGEALGPAREERVGVTHEHDRDAARRSARRPPARRAALAPAASACGGRGVDHRAVGERVAERHAELDQVGAGLGVGGRDRAPRSRRPGSRPSGTASAPRARARPAKAAAIRVRRRSPCASCQPSLSSASARSLSPRPDRQIRSIVSPRPPRGARAEHPGDRVRGLERRDDALELGEALEGAPAPRRR